MPTDAPAVTYSTSLTRRCHACDAALRAAHDRDVATVGCDVLCTDCGEVTRRDPVRCPHCLRVARFDEAGTLFCPAGCAAPARPHHHLLDTSVSMPKRAPGYSVPGFGDCDRELPYAGWELVLRERVKSTGGAAGDANTTALWGLVGMHDGNAWGDYDVAYGEAGGGLQTRWGKPDDAGRETTSEGGAAYEAERIENVVRIADMVNALDAFSTAVKADPSPGKRGHHALKPSTCLVQCVVAAMREDHHEIDAAEHRAKAIAAFMAEQRWEMLHEVGGTACKILVNAILARGGSYAGADEVLSYAEHHATSFGSYRAALWFAFYTPVRNIGDGSPLAGMGSAEYTHTLQRGVQLESGKLTANPTRNGRADARNVVSLHLDHDVWACIAAARIGGQWSRKDPDKPEAPRVCDGGRVLTAWERELVRLCDVGVEVAKGEDWRRLAVVEAVARIRREASQRRDDAAWGTARHLSLDAAKVALSRARRALTDALVAWEMIPLRIATKKKQREEDPEGPPREAVRVSKAAQAHASWDVAALR